MKKALAKILALALCAVLLVTGTVFITLAYLQDKSDVVKNTFTSANINITLNEIQVDETGTPKYLAYNEDGKPERINPENSEPYFGDDGKLNYQDTEINPANRVTEQEQPYRLVPGNEYVKDPTITVHANSEDCFLVIAVYDTMFKGNNIEESYKFVDQNNNGIGTIYTQLANNGWHAFEDTKDGNVYELSESFLTANGIEHWMTETEVDGWPEKLHNYTLYYYSAPEHDDVTVVAATIKNDPDKVQEVKIFEGFEIKGKLTEEQSVILATAAEQERSIEIIAFAFQTTGFGSNDNMSAPAIIWRNFNETFIAGNN